MITLERLFQNYYNQGLNKSLYSIRDYTSRLKFLVEQTERITGLEQFGEKEVTQLLDAEMYYSEEVKMRVKEIILGQRRKYQYLFR